VFWRATRSNIRLVDTRRRVLTSLRSPCSPCRYAFMVGQMRNKSTLERNSQRLPAHDHLLMEVRDLHIRSRFQGSRDRLGVQVCMANNVFRHLGLLDVSLRKPLQAGKPSLPPRQFLAGRHGG